MASDAALSLLSRYEALVELSGDVNASTDIAGAAQVLVRRLKYVADVFSWRYYRLAPDGPASGPTPATALVVDGHRGEATVARIPAADLGRIEGEIWRARKARTLEGDELAAARADLAAPFQKPDIVQIYACPRFGGGQLEAVLLFSKRRQPLSDLDVKFVTLAGQLLHDKVNRLWAQERQRELEAAYLQQDMMLRQSEKLATLGRLSAGIAHEINNPLSAAMRNAEQLASELSELQARFDALGRGGLTAEERAALERHRAVVAERVRRPLALDAVRSGLLEGEVEEWLDDRGVGDGWALAPNLVVMGFDPAALTDLAAAYAPDKVPAVLALLSGLYSVHALLEGIRTGTGRVREIVGALRSYSYLDQAPIQSVDVNSGIEATLVMLGDRLKDGIALRRELDPDLPRIEAHGRELNQVWTNIIDNALQAMEGRGELTVRTYGDGPWVVVAIADTGPGIPAEVRDRIFDPFFTTRPPGAGAGLGLNVSHNIVVQQHGGRIDVRSEPGATCFEVRLPLAPAAPAEG